MGRGKRRRIASIGGNYAFPVFAVAKAKTGAVFDERAYSARFDVTMPPPGALVRVRHDRIRFKRHNPRPDLLDELPPIPNQAADG